MTPDVDVLIVGAGFAGLYALHKMREIGASASVIETAEDVGGVWYWNKYPGARCDVESLQYSYSFSDDLQQEWQWTERYARQPEIYAYLRHVADRFDLRRSISFGTSVVSATFDDAYQCWRVSTDKGDDIAARYCIMASGSLSVSRLPDLPGIENFTRPVLHTGNWPDNAPDFEGQNVAVIGTGSSGVQAIPLIAERAKHLIVFQRTPNFVVPARNHPLAAESQARWKSEYPAMRAQARQVGTLYDFSETPAFAVSSEAREAEYQRRWEKGGVNFVHAFKDIMTDGAANQTAADFVHARIRQAVNDPVIAERLSPKGYPLGAKRICVGSEYYETYNRDNVTLVDLRETPIVSVNGQSIQTSAANHAIDILICATGYDALTGALMRIDIRGRGGVSLAKKWSDGPRNYLGLMSAEFPNMFIITGPGSPSVLVNMVVGIEQHVDWIAECVMYLMATGSASIVPRVDAEDKWVQRVNDEAASTLFTQANSWYLGANIPGKARVFMPFVGGIGRYRAICDKVAADAYPGFDISKEH